MPSPLDQLEPRLVWRHFDAIRQIPRPSKNEERIAEHVVSWARGRRFEVKRDRVGNVVVRVPASPGHEKAPVTVLQGHLDMVPEKNSDVSFDFLKDPIQVRVDGDYVYAKGTTLGADNGIGVAGAMAVAEDPSAVHGPLELLFTVDEETGLTGAMQLDPAVLAGRTLLNLDTEEDAALYIGCAGGADTHAKFAIARKDTRPGTLALHIAVRSLRGGHSGVDIHENRGNALKFLLRVLDAIRERGVRFAVVWLGGGSKHNAIPREADAVIRIAPHNRAKLRKAVEGASAALKEEFGEICPNAHVDVTPVEDDAANRRVWRPGDARRVIDALLACPHGVLAMSRAVPGLVETSNNLAVVATEDGTVNVTTSTRSSVMPSLAAATGEIAALFRLAGAEVELQDGYPGWKPNPNSSVLKLVERVYEQEFRARPHVKAIHAGLECGLIGERCPGMDMVSFGPQIESPHSPDERVQISTVGKFYRLLKATLAELA